MAQQILVQQYEFYGLLMGWVFTVVFGLLAFASFKLTPAKVFLKAWFKKCPVALTMFRTGLAEFKLGKTTDPGSMELKDLGVVQMVEGSHLLEKNSKVPLFITFAEYGESISKEYAPIIQELREDGFTINSFKDYQHLVKLASDVEYQKKVLEEYEGDALVKAKEDIEQLKTHPITINPYKSYKFHELASMFPFNTNPVYIDAKITHAVARTLKKLRENMKIPLYIGLGALMIVLAIVIVFKVIKQPEPQVIIRTLQSGVEVAKDNITIG